MQDRLAQTKEEAAAEERRLLFVGITRARDFVEIGHHAHPHHPGATPALSPYLEWFSFLVHDVKTGLVPTTPDDTAPYIHLRLRFGHGRRVDLSGWLWSRPTTFGDPVPATWLIGGAPMAWELIGQQAEWMLCLVEAISGSDDEGVERIGQFLHYFANMAQMTVR